jgi:glycerol-3-phosphate dehydrogenase
LISIAGGKLTGYRVMAKKTVDVVSKRLNKNGKRFKSCSTNLQVLVGGDFLTAEEIESYIEQQVGESKQIEVPPSLIRQWVFRYGKETERIVELGYEIWPKLETKSLVPLIAEMYYCIDEEMVAHPCDFWNRRIGAFYFNFPNLSKSFESLYPYLAEYLSYSERQRKDFEYQFYAEMDTVKPS